MRKKKRCMTLKTTLIIFNSNSGGVESNWVHSALRPPICLLCQPRVIMIMEKLVEWLARETEVLGENLPQCHFVHHKPHMLWPEANSGCRGGKPATNCLSYGTNDDPRYLSRYSDWLGVGVRVPVGSRIFPSRRPDLFQWVPGALFPGVKQLGCEADHSPPTSAEVKKTWVYTSTPPYTLMA
jgi:hypothetical protein